MSDAWAAQLAEAQALLREAQSGIRAGASEEDVLRVRRCLGRLAQSLDDLDAGVTGLELDGVLSEAEGRRRRALVAEVAQGRRLAAQQLAQGGSAWPANPVPTVLSSSEARSLQAVQEREQDALLEDLGGSLRRQHAIGGAMKREVEEQQPLLGRLATKTERSDRRVQHEAERIDKFSAGKCSCFLWIVAILLALILIVLLATSGGCRIVYSEKYCSDLPWLPHHHNRSTVQ